MSDASRASVPDSTRSLYLRGLGSTPRRGADGLPRQIRDLPSWNAVLKCDPCAYCGGPSQTVDHIVPTGPGARRTLRSPAQNGTGACHECNNLKADIPLLRFLLGEQRRDRGTAPNDRCATTGKRIYYAERLAIRAVTKAMLRGELPRLRHYPCPDCGHWHLSRKPA